MEGTGRAAVQAMILKKEIGQPQAKPQSGENEDGYGQLGENLGEEKRQEGDEHRKEWIDDQALIIPDDVLGRHRDG
jgi:hypothetical protein